MTTPPMGIRNNNAFNLIASTIDWDGQTGTDGRFCVFDTMINSIRAGVINTCNHVLRDGLTPDLDSLIGDPDHGQAPPNENDTDSYIGIMCKLMGITDTATIDIRDAATMQSYTRGIVTVEQGSTWEETITDDEIAQGVAAAFQHLYGGAA